jgi:hypothetical protein
MVFIRVHDERNNRTVRLAIGPSNILYRPHLSSAVPGAIGLLYDDNGRGLTRYIVNERGANIAILISLVFLVSMLMKMAILHLNGVLR